MIPLREYADKFFRSSAVDLINALEALMKANFKDAYDQIFYPRQRSIAMAEVII